MDNELKHYGVIGMKWGVRRYESKNGKLTAAGKARYADGPTGKYAKKAAKYQAKADKYNKSAKEWNRAAKSYKKSFGGTDDTTLKSEQYAYSAKRKAKKYEAKAKAAMNKGSAKTAKAIEKNEARLKKHEALAGKDTIDRVKAQSTGKTLAQSYVFGSYGALKYNQARAAGAGRGKAAVDATLNAYANAFTGGWRSVIEPRVNKRR